MPNISKPLKDLAGLSKNIESGLTTKTEANRQNYSGIAGKKLVEQTPRYNKTESEKIIKNKNNAWIVLGRDRPSNRFSGYSGKGATGAGSIDIVVGRASTINSPGKTDDGETVYVDPNFKTDAARIHVSQRTDIDDNFDLTSGQVGKSEGKSGIGVKADGVRVIGREGVKIVTGTDSQNSQGGRVGTVKGIDLIAANDDSNLQPLVKGDNLAEALENIVESQKSMMGILENFLTAQMNFNKEVATHTHPVVTAPEPKAVTSPKLASSGISNTLMEMFNAFFSAPTERINLESFKMRYCMPMGDKYIKSRHNNTT